MRKIHLADDLKLRFPGRSADFDEGFEVGMIAVMMTLRETEFTRDISRESLEQVAFLAEKLGYYVSRREEVETGLSCTFRARRSKPQLRIVET